MTDELSPEATALLEAARQNHGPSDTDRQRVLTTLHRSLGIGLPIALTATASAGLPLGQGAASSAASISGSQAAAALPGAGAASSGASAAAATHAAGALQSAATAVAPSATQGTLGLFGKLLTWKAAKVLLAGAALGSAVGIGTTVVQRQVPDSPELTSKAGSAAAFATATSDAGTSAESATTQAQEVAEAPGAVTAHASNRAEQAQVVDDEVPPALEPAALAVSERKLARADESSSRGTTRGHNKRGRRVTITSAPSSRTRAEEARAPEPAAPEAALPTAPPVVEPPHELALIRRALTSLRDGDPSGALTSLAEHAARFPSGSFSTERRGLRVVALCAAGRTDEGERERTAFLKSAGSSPIATRVRGACVEHDD